ncbi:hypothetical protein [Corynebacterium mastitidis]|uniref:hypothetical protein n=1 Tax=Corynebacterium mastitidis TaxID=161890 RepID=UPI0012E9CCA3|nr:hypothetical protein [Corynebacterium mastitidis]
MPFTPVPFKHALAGALTLAPLNGLCTLIAAGIIDRLCPRRRLAPRQRRLLGLASGVGGSLLLALLTRPLVHLQGKHSPHGAASTAAHLLGPAAAGGTAGLAIAGPPAWAGARCVPCSDSFPRPASSSRGRTPTKRPRSPRAGSRRSPS